ncbi:MAG: P22 phage major capsid protein family protein [Candidatus Udaeobacter sp.]
MGAVTTEQQKLVLNSFAMVLQNNLVTGDAVTWNEYDGEMDDRNGLQVIEQITPRYNVTRTENGVKDLSAGTDGTVFGSELFQVTGTFNANMGWGDFVKIKSIGDARESQALLGAATSMASKIDAYVLQIATLASNNWTGADGILPIAAWLDAAAGYTRMMEEGVDENDLSYIFNYTDEMKLGDQIIKLPAPDNFSTTTYRKGFSGELNGVRTMFTNQLPVLTVGTRAASAAALVDNATFGGVQNVNYSAVAKAGTTNGLHLTQTIVLRTAGNALTVKAGEVLTFAGVNAFDNRKQAAVSPARLQQFTVCADAVSSAGGALTLTIFPAMIVPGSGVGDDVNINTAHATVTAAPVDGAAVTYLGAASAVLSPRLLIQKQAIVVNTVPLILPASDTSMRRKLTKIPLTVRMWQHSDFYTGAHGVRFDVALNANIRERRRIARVNGS